MMSERVEKRSSTSPLNKLGKSIAFGCALGVLVSLLKHQRDEGPEEIESRTRESDDEF